MGRHHIKEHLIAHEGRYTSKVRVKGREEFKAIRSVRGRPRGRREGRESHTTLGELGSKEGRRQVGQFRRQELIHVRVAALQELVLLMVGEVFGEMVHASSLGGRHSRATGESVHWTLFVGLVRILTDVALPWEEGHPLAVLSVEQEPRVDRRGLARVGRWAGPRVFLVERSPLLGVLLSVVGVNQMLLLLREVCCSSRNGHALTFIAGRRCAVRVGR